eukprot:Pgem_evm1s18992
MRSMSSENHDFKIEDLEKKAPGGVNSNRSSLLSVGGNADLEAVKLQLLDMAQQISDLRDELEKERKARK